MNPYLISYFIHQTWRISHDNAPKLADELQSKLFYNKTTRILKNHDQKIEQNQFYNLIWVKTTRKQLKSSNQMMNSHFFLHY